jgi:hypothetical protein
MFRLYYFSDKRIIIINTFLKSYPQIKGLAQIIQKFLYVLFAVILKPSAQSPGRLYPAATKYPPTSCGGLRKSAEKCHGRVKQKPLEPSSAIKWIITGPCNVFISGYFCYIYCQLKYSIQVLQPAVLCVVAALCEVLFFLSA